MSSLSVIVTPDACSLRNCRILCRRERDATSLWVFIMPVRHRHCTVRYHVHQACYSCHSVPAADVPRNCKRAKPSSDFSGRPKVSMLMMWAFVGHGIRLRSVSMPGLHAE